MGVLRLGAAVGRSVVDWVVSTMRTLMPHWQRSRWRETLPLTLVLVKLERGADLVRAHLTNVAVRVARVFNVAKVAWVVVGVDGR